MVTGWMPPALGPTSFTNLVNLFLLKGRSASVPHSCMSPYIPYTPLTKALAGLFLQVIYIFLYFKITLFF